MKRKRAILSPSDAVTGRPVRSFVSMLMAIGTMLLAGCAGFERDWKRSVAAAPSGEREYEGAWAGTWSSPGTGHSGRLRCVISGPSAGSPDAQAAFTYHATWAIFAGTFPTKQPIHREPDGSLRSIGSWTLPRLAGGRYDYDIRIRGNRFTGTWKCARDSGAFEMTRARTADQ